MPKFKLKTKVAKLDEVPEAFRAAYVERDGAFYLDEFDYDDKEELSGTLERVRNERKQAKADLEKFKDIDPEKAREALQKLQQLEDKKLMDKGEFDRLLAKRKEEYDLTEADLKKQLAERDARLDHFDVTTPVKDAALKAGILPEDIDDVMEITRKRFKREDGKIIILDKDGDPSTLTLEKFWGEEFKTQKPKFYGASGAGGSGAPAGGTGGGNGSNKSMKRADFDKLDATAKHDFIVTNKGTLSD